MKKIISCITIIVILSTSLIISNPNAKNENQTADSGTIIESNSADSGGTRG